MPSLLLPLLTVGTLLLGGAAANRPSPDRSPRPVTGPGLVRATTPPASATYVAPLPEPLRVLTPFDPPATPYGPGHLGVDLAASQGESVRAAGPGTVTFAGPVAGRGVVVIAHPDGIDTEYEPLVPDVHAGAQVTAGTVVGQVHGTHAACAPATCLHWGARRGRSYLDPLDLLRPPGPVRLLPWGRWQRRGHRGDRD